MEDFKNPALCRVKGILTGYCVVCGEYIGNENDTDYFKLIRAKYCKRHAQETDYIKAKIRRKDYNNKKNQNRKEERSATQKLIDQYRIETREQKRYIQSLQRLIDDYERRLKV